MLGGCFAGPHSKTDAGGDSSRSVSCLSLGDIRLPLRNACTRRSPCKLTTVRDGLPSAHSAFSK